MLPLVYLSSFEHTVAYQGLSHGIWNTELYDVDYQVVSQGHYSSMLVTDMQCHVASGLDTASF